MNLKRYYSPILKPSNEPSTSESSNSTTENLIASPRTHVNMTSDDLSATTENINVTPNKEDSRKKPRTEVKLLDDDIIGDPGLRKVRKGNVDYVLAKHTEKNEIDYRIRVTAVLDVIRLILGQGLPLHGHDESATSLQRGNFLEITKWYCDRTKEVDAIMFSNALRNNQMASPKIQKDMISACSAEVRNAIINEIGNRFFSLLVDKALDSSIKEQMTIVVRFVNDHGEVIERFLGVVYMTDTSIESLKNGIDDFFAKNGLSLSRVRGQCYDGASNMRGELNGLKQHILKENKQAHYIHCFLQQLQLLIVTASNGHRQVCEFFSFLVMIVNAVGSLCKRKDSLLQKHHEDLVERIESGEITTGRGNNQEPYFAQAGDSRWGSHFKTICRILEMWDAVKDVLENIYEDGTDDKVQCISVLIDKLVDFEFVFIAHFIKKLLAKTNLLSLTLQQKNQNICNAAQHIRTVMDDFQEYKNNYGWNNLMEELTQFCSKHNIFVPKMEDAMPGRVKRQMTVDGRPKTYYHYFHNDFFCKVIDLIMEEMNNRFSETSSELLTCIACLSPRDSFRNFDSKCLLHLAGLYPSDFSYYEKEILIEQLRYYITFVKSDASFKDLDDIGDLAKKMVSTGLHKCYRLVYRLIELALVLPVSTATVQRSFSEINFIKNDLRNRMGDEYLTDGMLCYIEKEVFVGIENEAILRRFQDMSTQKYQSY